MKTLLLDLELARRLEMSEAMAAVACGESVQKSQPEIGAAIEPIAGGYALYCGSGNPVTQAVGLGLNGPVTEEEFQRLEEFYWKRKEPVRVETCPLADASLFEYFRAGGYGATEFTNVMARPLQSNERWPLVDGVEIRLAGKEEMELWTLTVAKGFAETFPVTQEFLDVMKLFATGPHVECYLASLDGRVVGGATLAMRQGIGGLFGASTLLEYRRRGVQTALLNHRLNRAVELGCDLAVSLARPGSASEHNIVRRGFQVLYTRIKFEKACPGTAA